MKHCCGLILLMMSCQKVPQNWRPTDHSLADRFAASSELDKLVYKDGLLTISTNLVTQQKPLVMVRYAARSLLAHELNANSSVVGYASTDSRELALVEIQSEDHLNALAALAHADDGFACGRLRMVDPEFALVEESTQTAPSPVYSEVRKYAVVESLLSLTNELKIRGGIEHFVALGSRFHTTNSGLTVAASIKSFITTTIGASAASRFEFEEYTHKGSNQKSLIVRLPGTKANASTVVIGAHLDSIVGSRTSPNQANAPGADDDASGMSTIFEVIRVLAEQSASFDRSIEFQFYAAEEVGLIGSAEIAAAYRQAGREISAMMQFDMDAYSSDPESRTIFLPDNDTDASLRRSVKDLLNTYLDGDYADGTIKGGTSDHESWTLQGYPAVFPFEHPTQYNRNIHTASDTLAAANNIALSERFAKLALAFLSHHAGLAAIAASSAVVPGESDIGSDIALAATKASTAAGYRLFAATPESVNSIEVCPVNGYDDVACSSPAVPLTQEPSSNARSFFSGDFPVSFSNGIFLRFNGYNTSDQLSEQRTVQVNQ
jgi:Zn-dependent M28 family amino/carboxypeptidase